MSPTPPLSRFVQPEVSEARLARLWSGLAERLERGPSRAPRWWALGGALCCAAVVAFVLVQRVQSPDANAERAVLAGAKLETASDALAVTLADGSAVQLASRTQVEVRGSQPSSVALALKSGEVACDVPHREGRSFTVTADGVEVRVVGTQFRVKATPLGATPRSRVEVQVTRGVVEVRSALRPGVVARVAAGQLWVQSGEPEAPASLEAGAPATKAAEPAEPTGPEGVAPRQAAAEADSSAAPGAPAGATPGASSASARELFEKAGERRRAGDAVGAARAYEELLRRHAGDSRAGLSAFELGRLRMDRLGDTAGAVQALERAVALGVGPSFREDALARLVSAYAAQGSFGACARARDRYLKSYPGGVHASAVASRCGTR